MAIIHWSQYNGDSIGVTSLVSTWHTWHMRLYKCYTWFPFHPVCTAMPLAQTGDQCNGSYQAVGQETSTDSCSNDYPCIGRGTKYWNVAIYDTKSIIMLDTFWIERVRLTNCFKHLHKRKLLQTSNGWHLFAFNRQTATSICTSGFCLL